MSNSIGTKIKDLSTAIFWIGIIFSIIIGILGMISNILIGLTYLILGCFSARVLSLLINGFGQLIENSDKLVANFVHEEDKAETPVSTNAQPKIQKAPWKCRSCGLENQGHVAFCQQCGVSKVWSESTQE